MRYRPRITRRVLLRDMGKASLAVVVLGAAACSSEPDEAVVTSSGTDPTTSRPASTSSTTSTTQSSPTSDAASNGSRWFRVELGFVSAYVLRRRGEAAVIDTGVGGSEADIEAGLVELGADWTSVGHVVITHQHPDHQGSLGAVLGAAGNPPWYAGVGDLSAIRAPTEGIAVGDGDKVFDMDIIETPGHTPGHIAVLDRSSTTLFAGDAMNGRDGGVIGANPDFTRDMNAANDSIRKLAELEYDKVVFGHGDPVTTSASDDVKELAASL